MKKVFIFLSVICLISTANASMTINIQQVGANVIAYYSGSITSTVTLFKLPDTSPSAISMTPNKGKLNFGNVSENVDSYVQTDAISPQSFGGGGLVNADASVGNSFGIDLSQNTFYVPKDYSLGTSLQGGATWLSRSLTDLGLAPGAFETTWKSGETITINVIAIPEPSAFVLLAIGGIALLAKRKRRS